VLPCFCSPADLLEGIATLDRQAPALPLPDSMLSPTAAAQLARAASRRLRQPVSARDVRQAVALCFRQVQGPVVPRRPATAPATAFGL